MATFTIANQNDLNAAIATVSSRAATDVFNFTASFTLDSQLAPLTLTASENLTINGNNNTLDGAFLYEGFAALGNGSIAINDLVLTHLVARGGNGGDDVRGGGGGGGGLGGGLFVGANVAATLSNVAFSSNFAIGGNGGSGDSGSNGYGGEWNGFLGPRAAIPTIPGTSSPGGFGGGGAGAVFTAGTGGDGGFGGGGGGNGFNIVFPGGRPGAGGYGAGPSTSITAAAAVWEPGAAFSFRKAARSHS
jgi:hypothetical protein